MATYIKDPMVGILLEQYARQKGQNKTDALRTLLENALKDDGWAERADERYQKVAARLGDRWANPKPALPKKVFDDLYAYLDKERSGS